ncbi:MAG: nucleotidyl transferase AbiEii/AbiGii toxin family protein [Gammaproteobacteria bacterium]|nr:nucleotidyl transferase AbiEii/AbiGii toxin family protein [Gammaproteobacteria bacterium]
MIPAQNIVAWSVIVPWADNRQIEQDLIISRALVDIFSDNLLKQELRFRGGTALNKLHFPEPLRYSEDIDLVRTSSGPIGPILDQLRAVLEPWLGHARFDQSQVAPKLKFRVDAEHGDGAQIRLKVEINTREIEAFDPPENQIFKVENPWFTGATEIPTFSCEEMLATKLRALLQRNKGRDLYDLNHALRVFSNLNADRTAELCARYLALSDQAISKAQAQQRMFAKLANPTLLTEMRPLLPAEQAEQLTEEATQDAFRNVFETLINRLPGDDWTNTADMKERFGLSW